MTELSNPRNTGAISAIWISEMTFEDPQLYTKKFTVQIACELMADNDIFEMFRGQNEKDRVHMAK